ncbi:MAG: transcriptional repressor [Clostridia bacterium]|nr:transcriptional repressor [Clostridia bacterium]
MKGSNFSSKRELIYSTLCSTKSHPSAKWVYEQLKEDYPDLSLGTVYRNIALFKEKGMVIPVANVLGEERLDGDTSPHAHLVCKCCGRIDDIDMPSLTLNGDTDGFSTDFVAVTYFGICNTCNK